MKCISIFLYISGLLLFATEKSEPLTMDCNVLPCQDVLPGATVFEKEAGSDYLKGFDLQGNLVGWLALSTDVVKIKAYSGQPLETLIGLNLDGTISNAKIIRHSEPILLVGIPEQKLHDFVAFYSGIHATQEVVVGSSSMADALEVDVISGATVTALAQNRTILDTARALGVAVGIIEAPPNIPGHFVEKGEHPSWDKMVDMGLFGRLTVTEGEMNPKSDYPDDDLFIDLYFTLIDSADIGQAILGPSDYQWLKSQMKEDEHLLLVCGNGRSSFKGSGFVRGGIFDRIRIEQGLNTTFFRDTDYFNVSSNRAIQGPQFNEGAVFTVHSGKLDPGKAFDFIFLGSYYDYKGGFSRQFKEFRSTFRIPRSVYALDGPDPDSLIWRQAWSVKKYEIALLIIWLAFITFLFVQRSWMTGKMNRLKLLHKLVLGFSFLVLGLLLQAQPSITQVLTFIGSVFSQWDLNLFLTEPLLFVSWIFIAVTTVIWGRGLFCGWVCPFGALNELQFWVGRKLRLPAKELPDRVHKPLRWLRYVILAILIPVFLYSPELGEKLAEVEPFKTTFFVIPWARQLLFLGWWVFLILLAFIVYRPFCRYVCPLGAALALPSSFRLSGPYRRSYCSSCKICTKTCEPRAIREDGTIDPRECLSCMECETNYEDPNVCPPLIGLEKLNQKHPETWTEKDREKQNQLLKGKMKV